MTIITRALASGSGHSRPIDTGVFHILEHSVLAGSEKYPVKSPFLQLLKSSMASFLNAMTFPDKTVYPFATPNETDFKNLMDVYLNAVFCPLAMVDKAVFEQEGWHRGEDGTVSGVVYNEMQGALASPDAQLQNALERAMFPDTAYGFVSGGDPASIPALTYEKYKRVYHRHYSADNCCITLYGNLNMGEALAFLDEAYLSRMPKGTSRPRLTMQDEQPGVQVKIPYYTEKPEADEVQCALAWYTGAFGRPGAAAGRGDPAGRAAGLQSGPAESGPAGTRSWARTSTSGFDDSTLQPTLELVLRRRHRGNGGPVCRGRCGKPWTTSWLRASRKTCCWPALNAAEFASLERPGSHARTACWTPSTRPRAGCTPATRPCCCTPTSLFASLREKLAERLVRRFAERPVCGRAGAGDPGADPAQERGREHSACPCGRQAGAGAPADRGRPRQQGQAPAPRAWWSSSWPGLSLLHHPSGGQHRT